MYNTIFWFFQNDLGFAENYNHIVIRLENETFSWSPKTKWGKFSFLGIKKVLWARKMGLIFKSSNNNENENNDNKMQYNVPFHKQSGLP